MVQVSDESAEQNLILKVKDGFIGLFRERLVNELQKHTRAQKQEHQHNRHASQPPREGPAERVLLDAPRPKVKDQAVEEPAISFPKLLGPQCARKNGITDALKESGALWRFVLLHRLFFGQTLRHGLCIPWKGVAVNAGRKSETISFS
jgi:hypothetical protein